jgi:hypothetical protein
VCMLLAASLLAFGIFEVLALRYGAESRPGFVEHPGRDRRR